MSKYIDKDELWERLKTHMVHHIVTNTLFNTIKSVIDGMPTINIVECDECLYKDECKKVVKRIDGTLTWLNWCSFGERVDNE